MYEEMLEIRNLVDLSTERYNLMMTNYIAYWQSRRSAQKQCVDVRTRVRTRSEWEITVKDRNR